MVPGMFPLNKFSRQKKVSTVVLVDRDTMDKAYTSQITVATVMIMLTITIRLRATIFFSYL